VIDFSIPDELRDLVSGLRVYIKEEVLPAEGEILYPGDLGGSWHVIERLRDRARDRGLFAPQLPPAWGGLGLGAVGMALVHQECGATPLASLAINAMAPDEGNMHTLLAAGSDGQLETFLRPLADS
jgi:acyl-CoA dehydrogenase